MIQEYLRDLPGRLGDLELPGAGDRAVWDGLPDGVRTALIRRGEEYLGYRWPVMTCGDYLTFSRTGDRSRYEQKCHSRQQALCALALAECAEHRGRFLDDLTDGIWFVCEESGWQLPAHNSYIRDTARPVPDLFACESAANLSLIRSLLGGSWTGRPRGCAGAFSGRWTPGWWAPAFGSTFGGWAMGTSR